MSPKITPDHLARAALVYIRQSTLAQVLSNLESQRRQYALVDAAKAAGFVAVSVIDDDLGRSVWRDNLDEVAATIRMAIWCRGAGMIAVLIDVRKGYFLTMIVAPRQSSTVLGVARVGGRPGPRLRSSAVRRR